MELWVQVIQWKISIEFLVRPRSRDLIIQMCAAKMNFSVNFWTIKLARSNPSQKTRWACLCLSQLSLASIKHIFLRAERNCEKRWLSHGFKQCTLKLKCSGFKLYETFQNFWNQTLMPVCITWPCRSCKNSQLLTRPLLRGVRAILGGCSIYSYLDTPI